MTPTPPRPHRQASPTSNIRVAFVTTRNAHRFCRLHLARALPAADPKTLRSPPPSPRLLSLSFLFSRKEEDRWWLIRSLSNARLHHLLREGDHFPSVNIVACSVPEGLQRPPDAKGTSPALTTEREAVVTSFVLPCAFSPAFYNVLIQCQSRERRTNKCRSMETKY